MTKSIGDVLSENIIEFELKGIILEFNKLTIGTLVKLEKKKIDIQSLENESLKIGERINIACDLLWTLLSVKSKTYVESKENFFELFDNFNDIEKIMNLITENSMAKKETVDDSKKN